MLLSEVMRPKSCDDVIGQDNLCGNNSSFRKLINKKVLFSFILWGEPGCGKTSIIEIYLSKFDIKIHKTTGSTFQLKEVKLFCEQAEKYFKFYKQPWIVFVDEIHRLNKLQQDIFLSYVENGSIILIGATTENPSFEINKALLSRVKVYKLNSLKKEDVLKIISNTIDYVNKNYEVEFDNDIYEFLYKTFGSDVRSSINAIDLIVKQGKKGLLKTSDIKDSLSENKTFYDSSGEYHYNIISAFHKSVRNSDIDSSLYWLARMLISGEDRKYILRRMIRISAEDIGLSDPKALEITLNCFKAFEILGEPEGDIFLFYSTVYLCLAPKSNSLYISEKESKKLAKDTSYLDVPLHIRNPETELMKKEGYGKGYLYAHDYKEKTTAMKTLPKELKTLNLFIPQSIGFEKEIKKRFDYWKKLKQELLKKNQKSK